MFIQVSRLVDVEIGAKNREQVIKTEGSTINCMHAKCSEISRRQNDRKQDSPNVSRDGNSAAHVIICGWVVEADQRFQLHVSLC